MAETGRVLRPVVRCVLDLVNSRSLNAICVRAYTELPPTFHVTVTEMERLCRENGLRIIEHRRFQLLPLWAGKPRWMWPLLHPAWKTLMRSEEHTSELQSLMRISYAVFCFKK